MGLVRIPVGAIDLCLLQIVHTECGTQGILGAKRPGRGVNHSLPSNVKVSNEPSYTSIPTIRLYCMYMNNLPLVLFVFHEYRMTEGL